MLRLHATVIAEYMGLSKFTNAKGKYAKGLRPKTPIWYAPHAVHGNIAAHIVPESSKLRDNILRAMPVSSYLLA